MPAELPNIRCALRFPNPNRWLKRWLPGSAVFLLSWVSSIEAVQAQAVLPSVGGLNFQTSGPSRGPNIGDWYTTATSASPDRVHRVFINITEADLAGGPVTLSIEDAESNGAQDEVNGAVFGTSITCTVAANNCDPTRFSLLSPAGAPLSTVIVGFPRPGQVTDLPGGNGTTITFPAITTPGTYQITSETGALPIFGDATAALNDDDNTFIVRLTGGSPDILIGQFQGTVQQNTGASQTFPFFFLVGPGTGGLFLRNFDLDTGGTLTYTSPPGGRAPAGIAGTASGNAVWNGGGNLNTGGDTVAGLNALTDAGVWQFRVNNFTNNNQSLFEANTDTGVRLPLLDRQPRQAGNFTVQTDTTLPTTIGTTVCHPFTVTNLFFTSDIVNLTTTGTAPNYTVQFRAADGTTVLTDTDGDGNPDTGILAAGGARDLTLCVTPNPGATGPDTTTIVATSFMDREVRNQAVTDGILPPEQGNPQPQSVIKTTTIDTSDLADPTINKDIVGNSTPALGENVVFRLTVLNNGPGTARTVSVNDPLPAGLTFVSATPSQGTYDNATGGWTIGDLAPNASVTLDLTATLATTDPIINTATVNSANDSNPNNNQSSRGLNVPNLRLVKRITAITRSRVPTTFNRFVNDPNDPDDDAPGWSQFPPVGEPSLPTSSPLRSGDEVEYTIYFLSDGSGPALEVNLCDLVPSRTSLLPNSLQIQQGTGTPSAGGTVFSPLQPLPSGNACSEQANSNGAVIFSLPQIPTTPSSNVGFVRFRVRIG